MGIDVEYFFLELPDRLNHFFWEVTVGYHLPINLFSKIFFSFLMMIIRVWQHVGLCLWSPEEADRSSGAGAHRKAWAIRQGCSKLNPRLNKGAPCSNHWAFSPALVCQFLTVFLLLGFYITCINSLSILHVNPFSVISLQNILLPWSLFPRIHCLLCWADVFWSHPLRCRGQGTVFINICLYEVTRFGWERLHWGSPTCKPLILTMSNKRLFLSVLRSLLSF